MLLFEVNILNIEDILKDKEYKKIINKYLNHEAVSKLNTIPHHDTTTRLKHSINVSYKAYLVCKKIGLDYESAAIGGLLHDMYYNRIIEQNSTYDKIKLLTNEHPKDALNNARKYFKLNKLEENIIVSHMWPISKYIPKYKESFVVGYADKYCTFNYDYKKEVMYYRNKLSYSLGVLFLMFTYHLFN